ncbi:MAG: nucleoside-diphosphate kinase, partial [Aquificaceae bacterium]|nr:nucleoside-diphosphate kinase [Aquificaceae bacterium]
MEKTLVIVKPDAFKMGATGKIIDRFISEGFSIRALKMLTLTKEQAESFYYVHRERGFFKELVEFMSSGPVVAMVLEGENAIQRVRQIIGPTDSEEAR